MSLLVWVRPCHASFVRRALLTLFLGLCACEGDSGLGVASSAPIFQPPSVNFGPRSVGEIHELDVVLTSDLERPQTVLDVEFTESAGEAYVARLEEGGTLTGAVLPNNRSLGIRIVFQPTLPTTYNGTMRVFTEDKIFELSINGSGRDVLNKDIEATPLALNFGAVAIGTTVSLPFTLANKSRETQIINEVRSKTSRRAVQPEQSIFWVTEIGTTEVALTGHRIGARADIDLMAHYRPRSVGDSSDTLQIMVNTNGYSPLDVRGRAEAGGRIDCAPLELKFGEVRRGSAADLFTQCTVANGIYKIESVSLEQGAGEHFSLVASPSVGQSFDSGDSFDVTVRFSGRGLASDQTARLLIRSTHATSTTLELSGKVAPTPKPETALTVHLEWDTPRTDFDLHLVRATGEPFESLNDCYFHEKNPDWGQIGWSLDDPFLDRDDIENGGPEEINLATAGENKYDIYVHYYGGARSVPTVATVRIEFFGVTSLTETRIFDACGEMWKVAEVADINSLASVTRINEVTYNSASGMCP